jgi:acyl-coenzyme A synthetase/AMP-(fatty) acid ligase
MYTPALTPLLFASPMQRTNLQEIPHTATGKVSKLALRKMFEGHQPRGARSKAQPRSKL